MRLSDQVRLLLTAPAADGYQLRALVRLAAMRLEPPEPPGDPAGASLIPSWNDLLSTLSVRAAMRRELIEEPSQ